MGALDAAELRALFFVEAREHLDALSSGLVDLQLGQGAAPDLDALFRAAHSVKGGAGACDLPHVVRYTHSLEAILDDLRSGLRQPDDDLIATLLAATDRVGELLGRAEEGLESAPDWLEDDLEGLRAVRDGDGGPGPGTRAGPRCDWQIDITPDEEILHLCNDPLPVLELLAEEGLASVACDLDAVPALAELDPTRLHLTWRLELRDGPPRETLDDILFLLEDEAEVVLTPLERPEEAASDAAAASPARRDTDRAGGRTQRSIRVDTTRIDELLDEVGELVMAHAVVAERAGPASQDDPVLAEALKSLQRRMRALQDGVLSMRMRPIRDLFERVPRLVFDLGRELGKKAAVQMHGEWTEVDREVLEKLADPLVHLVRNALDHGLEGPDDRLVAGKPAQGTLTLSASHEGGDVVITIADDGGGIDPGRVLAKARERGLVPQNAVLEDQEAIELIFRAGFSTADAVTDISGRGVGMDVVRQNIEALGGRVDVRSTLGEGTAFRIALPLTLAILDGQLLEAGGRRYVVPIRSMVECLRPEAGHFHDLHGRGRVFMLRGQPLPVLDLAAAFGTRPTSEEPLLVVVDSAGRRVALQVDHLDTQRQFVLKALDRHHRPVPGLAGASVLTDGSLAMVLDAATLCTVHTEELQARAAAWEPPETPGTAPLDGRLVTFACGGGRFAVPGRQVVELRRWQGATPLPFSSPDLLGAIAFGGDVVPVRDGRALLAPDAADDEARPVVMILEVPGATGPRRLGLKVDRVLEVRAWDPDALDVSEEPGLLRGLLPDGEDVIGLLDLAVLGRRR